MYCRSVRITLKTHKHTHKHSKGGLYENKNQASFAWVLKSSVTDDSTRFLREQPLNS